MQVSPLFPERKSRDGMPSCAVCRDYLGACGAVPCSLPCGHNSCLACLQQIQFNNSDPACPVCGTSFKSVTHLAPNFLLKEALQMGQGMLNAFAKSSRAETHSTPKKVPEIQIGMSKTEIAIPVSDKKCEDLCLTPETLFFNEQNGAQFPSSLVASETILKGERGVSLDDWRPSKGSREIHCDARRFDEKYVTSPPLDSKVIINDGKITKGASDKKIIVSSDNTVTSVEDLVMADDEDRILSSVYLPSAPPLTSNLGNDLKILLEAEPPQWSPDSTRPNCMQCNAKFAPLTLRRHHCRFCGGIFCSSCTTGRCLLPSRFRERDPQRVCDNCCEMLEPIQDYLIKHVSNAAQVAVHDVTGLGCMRGWLNNPATLSMQEDIYKATNIVTSFCKIGNYKLEKSIPKFVLRGAKGVAILTVVKVGMFLTYKLGTGLLVARRDNGSWSPPSAIVSFGLGWGLQAGGELADLIIILPSTRAVKAFSSRVHISIGAGLSASLGSLGRLAEADLRVGSKGAGTCYTYCCSQGAFAGVSMEGNIVASRMDANACFYGDVYLTPDDILFGHVSVPRAAASLYGSLQDMFLHVD